MLMEQVVIAVLIPPIILTPAEICTLILISDNCNFQTAHRIKACKDVLESCKS
jgi:hypothetical protein